jgi:hypothetical protein
MNLAPATTAAFDDLLTALAEIRDGYVLSTDRFKDPLDVVEGYRYVGQALSALSELFLEGDPDHPRLAVIANPARKLQGDNPDAIYHYSRIRGDRAYRIWGVIDRECYTSFTIHGPSPDGALAGPLLGDVNDSDFEVEADGSYSITFSATPQEGNWLALEADAHCVVVRTYYQLETSAQNDPSIHVNIDIEAIDVDDRPPPLADEAFAARLVEGTAFLRQVTLGQGMPDVVADIPFVAKENNTLPTPYSFRDSGLPVPGAADIHYALGRWDLTPDEALVITGTLPPCQFANVMLWNKHMQTLEYRDRQASLNQAQLALEDDGSFRIVIAHDDPGTPNWLDTEGHTTGTIFWRLLLPESDPGPMDCVVVPLADAGG